MKFYIKGNYRKSIFRSDKGYIIGLFKVRDTNKEELKDYINKTITFTGYFYDLNEDDTYIFYGEELNHPRYGFQFQVSEYERIKPSDAESIIDFFASDLFPGIGEKMAKSIVDTLGTDVLDKIIKDKSCLMLVPKLSAKKADKIYEVLMQYDKSHNIIVKLNELGFSTKDSLIIYNTYKSKTEEILNNDIYKIIKEIADISFSKIDSAASILGYSKDDKRRVKAGILYVIETIIYKTGDTFLTKEVVYNGLLNYLNIKVEDDECLNELVDFNEIVEYNGGYYLKEIWDAEENIVNKLHFLSNRDEHKYNNIDNIIEILEKENDKKYNEKQKLAITKALKSNILIITGGPGTGKTTIIKAIVEAYSKLNKYNYEMLVEKCALLAPTGRASKRISESTNLPASTIHRFLRWNKENGQFMINENNKSRVELVIIDEVSMIDISLFDSLLKGLEFNAQIILVGDYNQLPSVGPGQILKDLIGSEVIDTVHLDQLYRQEEDSYITTLAYEIKDSELSENFLETKSDYTFLKCTSESIKQNLRELCTKVVNKGYDYKRVQVLAPMYKGENGIDLLNQKLQDIFNPASESKREIKYGDVIFRENDKILQLVNMPDENVFNGDIGVIKYIKYANTSKSGKNEIYVDFDGIVVKYMPKDFIKIKHGFIISIHKSQGSEFEMVILPISRTYYRMLYKKLIYTAVTRAKRKLILIGEPNVFARSTLNNNEYQRNSNLLQKLVYRFNK